jgi:anti-anti-sigma factor
MRSCRQIKKRYSEVNPLILLIPEAGTETRQSGDATREREQRVLRQLDRKIEGVNRPRLVLDCSKLCYLGLPEIHLLVACLERVMKRNGDIRLSGVSPEARDCLSQAGVERLFQIYNSREDAARSFGPHLNVLAANDNHSVELPRARSSGEATVSSQPLRWAANRESGERK